MSLTNDMKTMIREARANSVEEPVDLVNQPPHYTSGGIECIDALRAALTPEEFIGFCKGNAIKYLWRSRLKGATAQDLAKSVWYTRMANGDDPRVVDEG